MKKLFLVLLLYPSILFGQVVNPIKINILNDSKSKSALAKQEYQYIEMNKEAFTDRALVKGAHFLFEIEPGVIEELVVTRVSEFIEGTYSIIARKVGETLNEFSLSYSEGKIIGSYHRNSKETLYLGYQQEVASNYISNKPIEEPIYNKGNDEILAPNYSQSLPNKNKAVLQPQTMVPNVEAMKATLEDTITIDVMLVYTEAAEAWADSNVASIGNLLSQAMNKSQLALDNSNTAIELRLVHQYKTDYDERSDGVDSQTRLKRLTASPDFRPTGEGWENAHLQMREVHTLRDQYGADLVALIARINDKGGLAWLLGSTAGYPELGFSVNRAQQIGSGYTLIHEFGHNMGNSHSRTQIDAAANATGGLFHYSAGYQDKFNKFHTVMAYKDNLESAPLFSSPDLTYLGKQAGTNNSLTPEDNARSMREIKSVIAGYRPTKINPPILESITNTISIEMNREDERTVPISIANTGNSRLMWAADFDIPTHTVSKLKVARQEPGIKIKELLPEESLKHTANASFTNRTKEKNATGETVIYSTSFEMVESFTVGNYEAISQWRNLNSSKKLIKISNANSKTGMNHLRLESIVEDTIQRISSPFFGAQPFGTYEIEMDMAVGEADSLKERFDIYIYDGKNDEVSAGVVISEGRIYVLGRGEKSATSFYPTNTTVIPNMYKNFKIRLDSNNETVSYYYGGQIFATREFVDGRTPDVINFLHHNLFDNTTLDIDNLKITKQDGAYPWLNVNTYGGSVAPGDSQNLNLTFNTRGIAAGDYETKLVIQTNDPSKTKLEIPINLTVNTAVSNEKNIETPEAITLSQNYPNPFNPETNIKFSLRETSNVRLDVFTIQGQKVATLLDTKINPGEHSIKFNAENLASGVYLYRLTTPHRTLTRRMTLIK